MTNPLLSEYNGFVVVIKHDKYLVLSFFFTYLLNLLSMNSRNNLCSFLCDLQKTNNYVFAYVLLLGEIGCSRETSCRK